MERPWAEATIDTLEQQLRQIESLIGSLRAGQARMVAELDTRQVPLGDGCNSMREWLTGRLAVSPETASALTRLARNPHPQIGEAASHGLLSFDQTVETIRLAQEVGEDRAMEQASSHDVAGIRRVTASHRRISGGNEREGFSARHLVLQPSLDRSAWRTWGRLPGIDGSIVDRALSRRADRFPPLPDGTRGTVGQRMADALVALCQDSIGPVTTTSGEDAGTAAPLATIFVDADQAASTGGETAATVASGPRIGPDTLEAVLCSGRVQVIATRDDLPVWASAAAAIVPPALRRFVFHRDGGTCTADGCQSRYRLQPHHIIPRSQGGDHHPDNLTLLCWFHHHRVVHGMGYQIDPDSPPRRRRFHPPDRRRGPP